MIEPLRDIWQFVSALGERMDKIHMGLIAAGVAFYAMFAVFPGLAAIIALWGLWYDPHVIQQYVHVGEEFIPPEAMDILQAQVDSLVSGGRTSLGWTTFVSFMIATIAARAGVNALVRGLNAAYGVRAHSTIVGFILAYALTLAIVGVVIIGLLTIVVVPVILNLFTLGPLGGWLITALPWAGMLLIVMIGIGILYRYGPNVHRPRTPIFTWGSVVATIAWGLASLAFSAYLGSFNSYNRIYGSIGAVVALLMWFYLAAFSVMLGAIFNVELRRRRRIAAAREARSSLAEEAAEAQSGPV
ncbi:YihY/virulence factor BrkB family protein [Paracoccus aerodenitrificans]|uniref:YihY/virulence factor BrkB family protein n=1 Tax=Paracoccus aerodenitrificans TaxID=3017781 RepID=UPI0022F121C5|nr:YihY/virulence factor BrkB family protein [Paracoccus aerodenitrificans]WBU63825.1 YihY/virulence factor BrkB family protein [Paracoccus aerodenitrificans]